MLSPKDLPDLSSSVSLECDHREGIENDFFFFSDEGIENDLGDERLRDGNFNFNLSFFC
jgi:hypothetical protein